RLRRAVEVLDLARVLAVDEDVRVVRSDLERYAAVSGRAGRDEDFTARRAVAVDGNRVRIGVGVRHRIPGVNPEADRKARTEHVRPVVRTRPVDSRRVNARRVAWRV